MLRGHVLELRRENTAGHLFAVRTSVDAEAILLQRTVHSEDVVVESVAHPSELRALSLTSQSVIERLNIAFDSVDRQIEFEPSNSVGLIVDGAVVHSGSAVVLQSCSRGVDLHDAFSDARHLGMIERDINGGIAAHYSPPSVLKIIHFFGAAQQRNGQQLKDNDSEHHFGVDRTDPVE